MPQVRVRAGVQRDCSLEGLGGVYGCMPWPDTSCWEIGTSLEIWLVLNTSASRGLAHAQTRVSGEPWDPGYRSGLGMPPSKHSSGQGRGLSMTRSI